MNSTTTDGMKTPETSTDVTSSQQEGTAVTSTVTTDAVALAKRGWHLLPFKHGSKNAGEFVGTGWQHKASSDADQIARWVEQYEPCNWGLLLGPKSGVVDVEDDSPEGRVILEAAMEDCGVVTPCYTSGKSVHRLFQFDERIQGFSATVVEAFGTEWRFGKETKGAQSVIPPSVHQSGKVYTWLPGLSPAEVDVARLPDEMWELMLDLLARDTERKAEIREATRLERRSNPQALTTHYPAPDGGHTSHVAAAEAALASVPFADLLTKEGWQPFHGDEWTRPGSDWSNAKSATLIDDQWFQVWTNAAPISDGRYGKFRFVAHSIGYTDAEQVEAAKEILGTDSAAAVDKAFRDSHDPPVKMAGIDISRVVEKLEAFGEETTEDETPADKPTEPTFAGLDISELQEHADSKVDWIVDRIFSSDQPTLFGARSKCLKTTQLVDLAVSLASGSQWLGAFDIPKKRRVLFITGEANNRAIARRLKKAAVAHGTTLGDLAGMIRVEAVHFPKLPNLKHCIAIHDTIEEHGIEVVIIDPLYRGIPSDMDTNKMAQIGDAITTFTQWCQPASVIISHHVTKSAARELGTPPELEDMTGAGVAESCGNWWLVGRNEQYAWDWKHDLCVSFGGRDEQAGGRRILFNEADWTAEVTNLHEFIGEQREAAIAAGEDRKREQHFRKAEAARGQIMRVMKNVKTPASKSSIEDLRGSIAVHPFRGSFIEMVVDGTIGQFSYTDGRNRLQAGGFMLAEYGDEYERNRTGE